MRSIVLVTALLALAGCSSVGEVAEIMTGGGERTLREPLRPITPGPRVLVLALDGVGDAVLRDALRDGAMPRLAALVGPTEGDVWAHAYAVPNAPSVFPAETAAGWAAVFTGRPPSENGVAGNEWFDRDSVETFAPVPLSVGTVKQTLQIYTDDLLGEVLQVPTVFELADVRSHVSLGFVHRGADVLNPPDLGDLPDLLGAALRFVVGGDPKAAAYKALDDDTWTGVQRAARRHGLPRLQVAYFPGVDLATHDDGPPAQRAHLTRVVDRRIGDILDLYADRGALGDTFVLVVSDHGHAPSLADTTHSLNAGDPGEPRDLFEHLGRRLRPFEIGSDSTADFQAVMTYNEAVAVVTLADQRTCPNAGDECDWSRGPRLEEDVLPVARAFAEAGRTGEGASKLQGAIDLVLARASRPSDGSRPPYRVLDGDRLVSVADYLAANPRPDLLDFERRLGWLTEGPLGDRGGDVLVMAKSGTDRPIEERYYFAAPRRSGHGSATTDDGTISFVLAHTGRSGATLQALVTGVAGARPTQLDVTPLILNLLGVEPSGPSDR